MTPTPIEAVRLEDPYPYYEALVTDRPFAYDNTLNAWVAADASAVKAALGATQLRVRPTTEPIPKGIKGTAAGEVFGHLVRMTDGQSHHRLKTLVAQTLAGADTTRAAELAATHTQEALAAAAVAEPGGNTPYHDLMFTVPARTVAGLLGLTHGTDKAAATLIADFVQCIPAGATEDQYKKAALAAEDLQNLLGPALEAGRHGLLADLVKTARRADWQDTAPLLANALGFLSQTYDATAGLIGNTLTALARGAEPPRTPAAADALVREVVRHDAPIQNTRRFAAEPFSHAGATVEPGDQVLVLLAAANRDPAVNPDPHALLPGRVNPAVFTFGAAAHRCPGEELAAAVAGAVVTELLAAGWDPADLPATPEYRPLANARIPLL